LTSIAFIELCRIVLFGFSLNLDKQLLINSTFIIDVFYVTTNQL